MSVLDEHAEQILLSPTEALAAVRAWEQQGALLSLALRHVEATKAFADDGTVSMNAWLRNHAKMSDRSGERPAVSRPVPRHQLSIRRGRGHRVAQRRPDHRCQTVSSPEVRINPG
jgi:hypothetical protein